MAKQRKSRPGWLGVSENAAPARYWWLKRIVVLLILLCAVVYGVRRHWMNEADLAFQQAADDFETTIAELRQSLDLRNNAVAESTIAAVETAARSIHVPSTLNSRLDMPDTFRYIPLKGRLDWDRETVNEFLDRNQWVLRIIRQARLDQLSEPLVIPDDAPPPSRDTQTINANLPGLLTMAISENFFVSGNDGELVELLKDLLFIRDFCVRMESRRGLVPYGWMWKHVQKLTPMLIQGVAHRIIFKDEQDKPEHYTGIPADREQMYELIDILLNDNASWDHVSQQALTRKPALPVRLPYTPHASGLTWLKSNLGYKQPRTRFAPGPPSRLTTLANYLLAPAMKLDSTLSIRRLTDERAQLRDRNIKPTQVRHFERKVPADRGVLDCAVLPWRRNPPEEFRKIPIEHRCLHTLAATCLANRLYVADHGLNSTSIHDLVPDYLSEVPIDPYAHDQAPIRYTEDNGLPYSVGPNGKDDKGIRRMRMAKVVPDKPDDARMLWGYFRREWVPDPTEQMQPQNSNDTK